MPSFYSRPMGRHQLPLTPPEYQSQHIGNGFAPMYHPQQQQQQPQFQPPPLGMKIQAPFDFADRQHSHGLTYQPSLPSLAYQQQAAVQAPSLAAAHFGTRVAPILPLPIQRRPQGYEQAAPADLGAHQPRREAEAKAEKAVGGVAVKLDYEMEVMTDFVTEMAQGIIQPGVPMDSAFRKWVSQVLCATRLPSATILLSLQYLGMRMGQLSTGLPRREPPEERQRMLTVALILGSKFLDDNTFINRSWAEVSGIDVKILNWMEIDWFQAMDNRLHRDPHEQSGFTTWQAHWKKFESFANARRQTESMRLSPIDTTGAYRSPHSPWSASPFSPSKSAYPLHSPDQQMYDAPAFTPYAQTWPARPVPERSPESATHTGPTTPEYYATVGPTQAQWFSQEGYTRRTMFGLPAMQQLQVPQPAPQLPTVFPSHPQYSAYPPAAHQLPQLMGVPYANGHHLGCSCYYCAKSPNNYLLPHHAFGQAMSVAG